MSNPAVLRSLPDEEESKAVEEAFAGMPEKGTARFWNRLTGQISVVGASSYGLGEDWEPPVNYFQGRSERRARSGGGVNEVRFQTGPSSTRDESSYAYQEASATPLASSQPPLPSTTPAKQPASGFLATSTPFVHGVGRSGGFDDSFSFARQTPPHMSRTNVPPPAVAAGGEQSAFGQNTSFQTELPPNTGAEWTTGNATHNVGDASLINFLEQGGLPVKDIGVPVDNILPPVQRRFSSRPSLPGGGIGLPHWNTSNGNHCLEAASLPHLLHQDLVEDLHRVEIPHVAQDDLLLEDLQDSRTAGVGDGRTGEAVAAALQAAAAPQEEEAFLRQALEYLHSRLHQDLREAEADSPRQAREVFRPDHQEEEATGEDTTTRMRTT
ncbi:hypothetical protein C8R47DRAFT_1221046 [Mycena vitilis]|nr:hypothetical protein C8R47DRAFT_1221046 [Mycena vitilis]